MGDILGIAEIGQVGWGWIGTNYPDVNGELLQ